MRGERNAGGSYPLDNKPTIKTITHKANKRDDTVFPQDNLQLIQSAVLPINICGEIRDLFQTLHIVSVS
jgi:hypothetical protein